MKNFVLFLSIILFFSCRNDGNQDPTLLNENQNTFQAISQLGDTLWSAPPNKAILKQYQEKKLEFEKYPDSLDALIWYGRFTAYLGNYNEAIEIYSEGLNKFPNQSRLLRHRGHRYITLRKFEEAIADLSLAAELIEGTSNQPEEDGLPNALNIPVSSRHGNIYYHLGLAYYLDRQMLKSLDAFKKCLSTSNSPDNVVSATHWIYMIQNRLGRKSAGDNYLRPISADMNVIENTSYLKACLLYKGELSFEELFSSKASNTPSDTALQYALGNWVWYTGNPQKATEIFQNIVSGSDWASFGYIAAETDLAKPYVSR